MRALLAIMLLAGCYTFAPWDQPERWHCVCDRDVDPDYLIIYACGNEGAGAAEEEVLEWCTENMPGGCVDCHCESQGEPCDP